jgi:hypothetical protein
MESSLKGKLSLRIPFYPWVCQRENAIWKEVEAKVDKATLVRYNQYNIVWGAQPFGGISC